VEIKMTENFEMEVKDFGGEGKGKKENN